MTRDGHFAAVSLNATTEIERHEILGGPFSVSEIDAAYRPEDSRYAIGMTVSSTDAEVLFNLADPDGWVLIDPGVTGDLDESTGITIASASESLGALWRDVTTQRIRFAAITPDMSIVFPVTLDELSPEPMHRLPHIVAHEPGFAALWQVDDPAEGESFLEFVRLDNDADLIGGIVHLFYDLQAQPPSDLVLADGVFGVLFATQPYFDAPVLDLHLAVIDEEGVVVVEPVDAGRVRRPENRDAAMAWSGGEFGIASALPLYEEPGTERVLAFRRFHADGTAIGTPFTVSSIVGDVSRLSVAWDGEGYGVTYAVAEGETLDVQFIRLGCILPY